MHRDRRLSDLRDLTPEEVARIHLDRERRPLARLGATDVGFAHIRVDLHLGQVHDHAEEQQQASMASQKGPQHCCPLERNNTP